MADTTGHQPGDTYTSAQPVTSDIPASQPSPAVQHGLPNGGTFPTSSGAPSTPTLPNHGPPTVPPPPSVSSTTVSAPPAPPAPMVPSGRVIEQTPFVPSERPVGTVNYLSSGTPARTLNYNQRQPFPQQQAYQQMPQPVYHGQHPAQQGYAHPQAPRPLIVDPPRRSSVVPSMIPPQPQQSNGFPSPGRDYGAENRKFNDDLSRITLSFQQGIPEAVRRGVRDNWEKCLLGSEFHQAFVLNAAVHHSSSTPGIQSRAIRDFGAIMVSNCKQEIVEKWSTRDIDDIAPALLAKASNAFLDQCLALRLQTIDAKPLIQALAKAERLGYEPNDILLSEQQERVIPNTQLGHAPPVSTSTSTARPTGAAVPRARPDQLQCLKCFRTFTKKSYFDFHISRSVCTKVPPSVEGFRHSCPNCGQGFTHVGGMNYHVNKGVCEPEGFEPPEPAPPANTPATPAGLPNHMRGYTTPSQVASAKSAPLASSMRAAASPTERTGPYAHLSQQDFDAMNEELRQAEVQYAPRFHEAEAILNPDEKQRKLDSLRNTFGTKQSIIRKKYGVRLRERRTKAEIQAERERMGLADAPAPQTTPSTQNFKQYSHTEVAVPAYGNQQANASAWTAANKSGGQADTSSEASHGNKRRRIDDGEAGRDYQTPYPPSGPTTKVSDMAGGLTASVADAAMQDPTLPSPQRTATSSGIVPSSQPALTYQQSGARVEVHLPTKPASSPAPPSGSPSDQHDGDDSGLMIIDSQLLPLPQIQADQMQDNGDPNDVTLEGDGSGDHDEDDNENEVENTDDEMREEGEEEEDDDDSDSDDDDDEDIPPTLPVNNGPTTLTPHYRHGM